MKWDVILKQGVAKMDALKNVEGVEGVETMGIQFVLGVSPTS